MVPAPPDQVFGLISETSRYSEWVTGTDAVTRTDGPAREGSTYDEVNPILGPWKAKTSWRVVEHEVPRRSRHETGDIPLSSHFQVVMEVAAEGDGSRVTITLRGEPSMGPLGAASRRSCADRSTATTGARCRPSRSWPRGSWARSRLARSGRCDSELLERVGKAIGFSPEGRPVRVWVRGMPGGRRDRGGPRDDHGGPRRRARCSTCGRRTVAARGASRGRLGAAGTVVQLHLGRRLRVGRRGARGASGRWFIRLGTPAPHGRGALTSDPDSMLFTHPGRVPTSPPRHP